MDAEMNNMFLMKVGQNHTDGDNHIWNEYVLSWRIVILGQEALKNSWDVKDDKCGDPIQTEKHDEEEQLQIKHSQYTKA